MRTTTLLLSSCLLLSLTFLGCDDSDDSQLPCGAGTERIDGLCEAILVCGEGTTLQESQCVPSSGTACGDGTRVVDGVCVPDTGTVCGAGTTPIDGVCVNQNVIICGAGTEAQGGECVPTEHLECGEGTEMITDDDGDVNCVPLCDAPEIWDSVAEACASECGAGTVFDTDTGICGFACEDDEFYDAGSDTCLTVPACGLNSELVDGACEGWPWHEISLDTICARRAHYICDNLIDCCGDAGTFYEGDPLNNGLIGYDIIEIIGNTSIDVSNGDEVVPIGLVQAGWPLDHSGCLTIETVRCEMTDVALYRHLVAEGQATVDTEALEAFDEYYERDPEDCTLPAAWVDWKVELQHDLINGTTAIDSECLDTEQCVTGTYCAVVDEDDFGMLIYNCVARGLATDNCDMVYPGTYFATNEPVSTCLEALECIDGTCVAPLNLGDSCADYYPSGRQWFYETPVCDGDTICRPTDPITSDDTAVCRNYLAADAQCRPPSAQQSGYLDWCGPGLWCDDDAYNNVEIEYSSNRIGKCVAAAVDGADCEFCFERGTFGFGHPAVFSDRCEDDSVCSLRVDDESEEIGYEPVCASSESVCLYRYNSFPPVCVY